MKKLLTKNCISGFFILCYSLSPLKASINEDFLPGLRAAQEECKETVSSLGDLPIPEDWMRHSMISLLNYQSSKAGSQNLGDTKYTLFLRQRIQLNDFYAVDQFESLELNESILQEVRIIHTDGRISEIDLSNAVSEFSYFEYKQSKVNAFVLDFKKIPIPNLYPGDIIEIDNYWEGNELEKGEASWQKNAFENLRLIKLEENLPNLLRVLDLKVGDSYYLNWKSMNEAPPIVCVDTSGTLSHYRFVDKNRPARKREYFYPSTLEKPFVKFLISNESAFGTPGGSQRNSKDPNNVIDKKALAAYASSIYKNKDNSASGFYSQSMNRAGHYVVNNKRFISDFYQDYRTYLHFYRIGLNSELSNRHFISIFSRVLQKRRIDFEFIASTPNYLGSIDDIVSIDEVIWSIRTLDDGKIYNVFSINSVPDEIDPSLQGQKGICFQKKGGQFKSSQEHHFRVQKASENRRESKYIIQFDTEQNKLFCWRQVNRTGLEKIGFQSILPVDVYFQDLRKLYNVELVYVPAGSRYFEASSSYGYKTTLERLQEQFLLETDLQTGNKLNKQLLSRNLHVDEYKFLGMNSGSRFMDEPFYMFQDEFILTNAYSTTPNNSLIVNANQLFEEVMSLEESEDTIRMNDIDLKYSKTWVEEILLVVPPNYIADTSGLESFELANGVGKVAYSFFITKDGNILDFEEPARGLGTSEEINRESNLNSRVVDDKIIRESELMNSHDWLRKSLNRQPSKGGQSAGHTSADLSDTTSTDSVDIKVEQDPLYLVIRREITLNDGYIEKDKWPEMLRIIRCAEGTKNQEIILKPAP